MVEKFIFRFCSFRKLFTDTELFFLNKELKIIVKNVRLKCHKIHNRNVGVTFIGGLAYFLAADTRYQLRNGHNHTTELELEHYTHTHTHGYTHTLPSL